MSEPQHAGDTPDAIRPESGSTPPPLPVAARPGMAPPPLLRAAPPPARPTSNSILKTLLIIAGFIVFAIGSLAIGVLAWWIWSQS